MLTRESLHSQDNYKFVNGMVNVAWITGFARNVEKNRFLIQQINSLNAAIPIILQPKDYLPSFVYETAPVKVIAHLAGIQIPLADGTIARSIAVKSISIQRPTLLDMPAKLAWNKTLPKGASTDNFKPNSGSDGKLSLTSNTLFLAGFIENVVLIRKAVVYEGESKIATSLVALLRQTSDATKCLELRYYGKHLRKYYAECMEAMRDRTPLLVSGSTRVNVVPLATPKEGVLTPVMRLTYVHVESFLSCLREEVTTMPEWAAKPVGEQVVSEIAAAGEAVLKHSDIPAEEASDDDTAGRKRRSKKAAPEDAPLSADEERMALESVNGPVVTTPLPAGKEGGIDLDTI